ncbi:GFA family protein [Parasulfitobacter algicola]|uniref:GFA family protein n=1 Tax=Parasulfitobacter algicola TaxID=2614809 RepID=A0ABX2IUT2_9RHOB|nr:GFA family protein [Sulfitobacter algicola]NSX54036.1 GFA family protein [Sulfitobacter algicola]
MSKTGGCLCGAVTFELAEDPKTYGACHCQMCRKFSGGIEMSVQVMPGGITWQGEDNVQTFASSEWAERGFCKTCGSSLLWRLTAPGPMQGMLILSAGALDSLDGMVFDNEVYIDHKPASHAFAGDDRTQMTEAEVLALYGPTE